MDHTWGVGELNRTVDRILRRHFSDEVWVSGEIAGLDRPASGHVYLRLVDHDPARAAGRAPEAVLHVTLFESNKRAVNQQLQRAGIGRIGEGMQVRIRGSLELYPAQGRVQLRMTGIDAAYTLGAMAAARDRVLELLRSEGLLTRNGALAVPHLPLRIGLVTSAGSAAAADFLHELEASGIGFSVVHCDTRVQGVGAERGVAAAIAVVAAAAVDLVVVVRGGGDRLDLAVFDSEVIARAIATCTVPVWSGIGHEIDRSVADAVAHTAFKTPTAVAAAIVGRVQAVAEQLDRAHERLAAAARGRLAGSAGALGAQADRGARAATAALRLEHRRLDGEQARLVRGARHANRSSTATLDLAASRVAALDPQRALERGWVVLRAGGRVVRRVTDVAAGDEIEATLADGLLTATVTSTSPTSPDAE